MPIGVLIKISLVLAALILLIVRLATHDSSPDTNGAPPLRKNDDPDQGRK